MGNMAASSSRTSSSSDGLGSPMASWMASITSMDRPRSALNCPYVLLENAAGVGKSKSMNEKESRLVEMSVEMSSSEIPDCSSAAANRTRWTPGAR